MCRYNLSLVTSCKRGCPRGRECYSPRRPHSFRGYCTAPFGAVKEYLADRSQREQAQAEVKHFWKGYLCRSERRFKKSAKRPDCLPTNWRNDPARNKRPSPISQHHHHGPTWKTVPPLTAALDVSLDDFPHKPKRRK